MTEAERLSALIGDIYDAALAPALWPATLGRIADFVGGHAAGLLYKSLIGTAGDARFHYGVEQRYIDLYENEYWRYDPLAPLIFFPVGHITTPMDYLSEQEARESRFFREWVAPQGWIDSANVVLDKTATNCAILSVVRSEADGMVDAQARRRLELVVPHVRRAVLIGRAIDLRTDEVASLTDALDSLAAAMLLVDANGGLIHANAAAQRMLAAGDPLRNVDGRLVVNDAKIQREMRRSFASAGAGDDAVGADGIAIPLTGLDGVRRVAHVLPLTSGARRRAGVMHAASAAVFLHESALRLASAPEALARTYHLTPAELRVLLAIAEIGGAPEVALALGIAESTVKTHLARLYEKTGARRHADLVKLLAGFAHPMIGSTASQPRTG